MEPMVVEYSARTSAMPFAALLCDAEALVRWGETDGEAFALARHAGLRLGLVASVNRAGRNDLLNRLDEKFGPFDVMATCRHADGEACGCPHAASGTIRAAAAALLLPPSQCLVVGDTWSQIDAAEAAGATAALVPSDRTTDADLAASALHLPSLTAAVTLALDADKARRLAHDSSVQALELALRCS
jgi:beta-phosphoglucomutase-like phosphatase (HAD superfamily)